MKDREFLLWVRDRLVYVYNESPNVDFVGKLTSIAYAIDPEQVTPNLGSNAGGEEHAARLAKQEKMMGRTSDPAQM